MMIRSTMVAGLLALGLVAWVTPQRPLAAAPRQEAKASASLAGAVNLNTASQVELEKLPGVGPATAARIVEYRQKSGGFKKVEDLMNVKGIGEKTFLKLKPQLTVAPTKTAER